jgi:hypothetical protein
MNGELAPGVALKNWKKTTNSSTRMPAVPAETRTEHPNNYYCTNPIDFVAVKTYVLGLYTIENDASNNFLCRPNFFTELLPSNYKEDTQTDHRLSFDTTRTAKKMTRPKILLLFRVFVATGEHVYRAVA